MMSSTQYPITSTIINVTQDEDLQNDDNHAEEFREKSLNSLNIKLFDQQETSKDDQQLWQTSNMYHTQNISLHENINDCFESKKISIAYSINDDHQQQQQHTSVGEKQLKRRLVLVSPSTDSDGDFSDESLNQRHILKIQIAPTVSPPSEIVDNRKLNKSLSTIIVNRNNSKSDKKMSMRCENDSIYGNVTIIRSEDNEVYERDDDECDIENLSDDQKLVVLNGHHITVKCGSGASNNNNNNININKSNINKSIINGNSNKTELIQLTNGKGSSIMNIVNCNSDGIILNSGQCSPVSENGEDHLDSGTCSDVEVNGLVCNDFGLITTSVPPPLPPKGYKKKTSKLSESTCSDVSSQSSTADSMQYQHSTVDDQLKSPDLIRSLAHATSVKSNQSAENDMISGLLPTSLLHDIRTHSMKAFLQSSLIHNDDDDDDEDIEDVLQYESNSELNYSDISFSNDNKLDSNVENEIKSYDNSKYDEASCIKENKVIVDFFESDKFYKFHINEHSTSEVVEKLATSEESDESFAGYKDLRSGTSTIRSAKGTIRGVKNRVRNGIATFLQMQQTTVKNFKEKDGGKIVLYTTSMGVVRSTYAKCQTVKQILRTLMVKFEERDVFMSCNHQQEIRERMQMDDIDVPQLFVDGHYIGNADQVERLNETGELRIMLKPFKSRDSLETCNMCGGFKMLPCTSCGGSKKSIHRNHFTAEFIALKCMNCDEVGLVKCYNCA